MKINATSPQGADWDDVRREIFTPEEIAACDIKVALVGEIIKARHSRGYSQKKLEDWAKHWRSCR
jgi:hypothetical protein